MKTQKTRSLDCEPFHTTLSFVRLSEEDSTIKYWRKFFEHNKINQIEWTTSARTQSHTFIHPFSKYESELAIRPRGLEAVSIRQYNWTVAQIQAHTSHSLCLCLRFHAFISRAEPNRNDGRLPIVRTAGMCAQCFLWDGKMFYFSFYVFCCCVFCCFALFP